jgi:hypothetical protein
MNKELLQGAADNVAGRTKEVGVRVARVRRLPAPRRSPMNETLKVGPLSMQVGWIPISTHTISMRALSPGPQRAPQTMPFEHYIALH